MPLGDSITDGCCGENTLSMFGSYRTTLFQLSLDQGKKLTFVGSHTSGPDMVGGAPFPKNQEGHGGFTIDDGGGRSGLQPQIKGWLMATPPDIVLLMIGTNDVDIQYDLPNAPARLGKLLDTIIQNAPNTLIVLAQSCRLERTTKICSIRLQRGVACAGRGARKRGQTRGLGRHV